MKNFIFSYCFLLLFLCSCNKENSLSLYKNIPEKYHARLDSALMTAGTNSKQLLEAIEKVPAEQKEAMAFLICYMPERDLTSLSADLLIENVNYAYKAKENFSWGASIPEEIFFNEVLPYVVMNETRENWRKNFYERFSKYVKNSKDIFSAIDAINKNIRDELLVDYNINREKPDQSPSESIKQKMASCSGLSILLTDAFRSVCIPSRIAGTPSWYDNRGNHNWCEVWIDGKWYFTEYYPEELNKSWFLSSAGKADETSKEYSIYATSFKPAGIYFPLVWDTTINYVHAENVTERYISIYKNQQTEKIKSGMFIPVKIKFIEPDKKNTDKRIAVNIDVFDSNGQVDGGKTSDSKKDINDILTFILKKNHDYILKYSLEDNKSLEYRFKTKDSEITIELKK